MEIRKVDFSGIRTSRDVSSAVCDQLHEAFSTIGFVTIVNHGVEEKVSRVVSHSQTAFSVFIISVDINSFIQIITHPRFSEYQNQIAINESCPDLSPPQEKSGLAMTMSRGCEQGLSIDVDNIQMWEMCIVVHTSSCSHIQLFTFKDS